MGAHQLSTGRGRLASADRHDEGISVSRISSTRQPHAVLVPYPLQGHINPMVEFGKALAIQAGFRVTFVNNKHNHERISRNNNNVAASSKPLIEFVWIENGLPEDFDYSDFSMELHQGTVNMREPFKELLLSLNREGGGAAAAAARVSCVVFGSFVPWAHEVARDVGIPSVFFWPQLASVLNIYYHSDLLQRNGFFPYRKPGSADTDEGHRLVDYLPGIPPLRPSDIPSLLQVQSIDDLEYKYVKQQMDALTECKCAVINSFYELDQVEVDSCEALRAASGGALSIHMVGPLLPTAFLRHEEAASSDAKVQSSSPYKDGTSWRVGASILEEKTECIEWLDQQKEASVLYISFGSVVTPSTEEWRSIAAGLQASGQPFLWVIRPRSSLKSLSDILPEGFIEDTKERGMVIPWAPQLQVLSHRAVGAFMSHCGWNSTLESLSLGVPILPFPIFSDQHIVCRHIVDVWKIGLEIKRSPGLDASREVSRVVTMALQGEEGRHVRTNSAKLQQAVRQATLPQGSSSLDFQRFVRVVTDKGNAF